MSDDKKLELQMERSGPLAVVHLHGSLVRDNQSYLRKELEHLISQGVTQLAIDLERVGYMDSAGLGCCAAVQKFIARHDGGAMAVFSPPTNVEKTWSLIRLDLVIPVFPDQEKAVRWLRHRCSTPP